MAIELDHWKTEEIKVGDNVRIRKFSFDVKGDRNQENTGKVIEKNWNDEKGCNIYKVTCDDKRMGYQYLTRDSLVKIPDQPKFDAVANSNPYLLSFGGPKKSMRTKPSRTKTQPNLYEGKFQIDDKVLISERAIAWKEAGDEDKSIYQNKQGRVVNILLQKYTYLQVKIDGCDEEFWFKETYLTKINK